MHVFFAFNVIHYFGDDDDDGTGSSGGCSKWDKIV